MTRHPLHRGGFPPISPETIGKAFADGRAYKRLTGPARHVRIEPPIPAWEIAFCALVAFLIGVMVAFA